MAIKHRILDREKVLAAARVMVTRDGIRELTFQTLAKELNIRSQSLYNYFSNLDAVIEALGTEFMHNLHQEFIEQVSGIAGKDAIRTFAQTTHRYFEQQQSLDEIIYFVHHFPESSPFVQATGDVIGLLKRLITHTEFKHMAKESFVQNFISSVLGFTVLEVMGFLPDGQPSRDTTFESLLDLYLSEVKE